MLPCVPFLFLLFVRGIPPFFLLALLPGALSEPLRFASRLTHAVNGRRWPVSGLEESVHARKGSGHDERCCIAEWVMEMVRRT